MKILLIGDDHRIEEMQKKIASLPIESPLIVVNNTSSFNDFDLIIDLLVGEKKTLDFLEIYSTLSQKVVIIGAVKQSLGELTHSFSKPIHCHLIGVNGLPTFIHRNLWELSALNEASKTTANKLLQDLGIHCQWVSDRVGMVSPRVVLMIINEAFYTLQEGTASKKDIDLSMKLGTRYPYGPFEWAELIGIQNVYETLQALYQDTGDERYRVCPLLKQTYFQSFDARI